MYRYKLQYTLFEDAMYVLYKVMCMICLGWYECFVFVYIYVLCL